MVVNGVSTRKVTNITEELCGVRFSKSTVSQLCAGRAPFSTRHRKDVAEKTKLVLQVPNITDARRRLMDEFNEWLIENEQAKTNVIEINKMTN